MSEKSNHGKGPDPFERALHQTVRRGLSAPGAVCPEPEVLAAYFERSLSSTESAEWEKHFSLCGRCQQQLAALARSQPVFEKPSAGWAWLQLPRIRWLAPALVALGSVVVWIAIRPAPSDLGRIASDYPAQVAPVRTAPAPEKEKAAPESSDHARAGQPGVLDRLEPKKRALADELAVSPSVQSARPLREKRRADLKTSESTTRSQTAKNEAAPLEAVPLKPAPLKEQAAGAAAAEERRAQNRDAMARQEQDRPSAPKPQQAAPPVAGTVGGVRGVLSEQKTPLSQPEGGKADASLEKQAIAEFAIKPGGRISAPLNVLVPAPGGSVVWRIGTGGRIHRSLDAGKTWEPQTSGVQTDLTNGQAASATVCWLVGLKGTVLRTTDGLRWQKIAFPLVADLSQVEAPDALHAVITTADGQTYATENGGQSWQKR